MQSSLRNAGVPRRDSSNSLSSRYSFICTIVLAILWAGFTNARKLGHEKPRNLGSDDHSESQFASLQTHPSPPSRHLTTINTSCWSAKKFSGTFDSYDTTTQEQCIDICQNQSTCLGWSIFDNRNNNYRCNIYTVINQVTNSRDWISAYKSCSTDAPTSSPTTKSPTASPTDPPTANPTDSPTTNPTNSPTTNPTNSPTTNPTDSPTANPTKSPTTNPTDSPTANPTDSPTANPTDSPTTNPTDSPTANPTDSPTASPTDSPTANPTDSPTANPTDSPTAIPTDSPTANPTDSPTASPTDSPTANPTDSPTANPTDSPTASPTDSPTANPTDSPTANPTDSPTANPTDSPTANPTDSPTANPTDSPTANPTDSPTANPTDSPTTNPTDSPTANPTDSPTANPTNSPTASPTDSPTANPTDSPTANPTDSPTANPTDSPTANPTDSPTANPTDSPTANPTDSPTANPTDSPTANPTDSPTANPTDSPTANPTDSPTANPTDSPTANPTDSPTANPTDSPTANPTDSPTANPTDSPTANPTDSPTANPTDSPTADPTDSPTANPTDSPTTNPTDSPTANPTDSPTANPTDSPTANPTDSPTVNPTDSPTANPTDSPTANPTDSPTANPTDSPTANPSDSPTANPTVAPTQTNVAGDTESPSSSSTAAPTTFDCAVEGYKYVGGKTVKSASGITSAKACYSWCTETTMCTGYTWNSAASMCLLKAKGYKLKTGQSGYYSGSQDCSDESECFAQFVNYPGETFKTLTKVGTAKACGEACFDASACEVWVYLSNKKKCYLRKNYSGAKRTANAYFFAGKKAEACRSVIEATSAPTPSPTLMTPPPVTSCGPKVNDVMYIVDSSGSIDSTEWANLIMFLRQLSYAFQVGSGAADSRLAIVNYASNVNILWNFTDARAIDQETFQTAVSEIEAYHTGTATGPALISASEVFWNTPVRAGLDRRVAILLTDGNPNKNTGCNAAGFRKSPKGCAKDAAASIRRGPDGIIGTDDDVYLVLVRIGVSKKSDMLAGVEDLQVYSDSVGLRSIANEVISNICNITDDA